MFISSRKYPWDRVDDGLITRGRSFNIGPPSKVKYWDGPNFAKCYFPSLLIRDHSWNGSKV